MTRILIVDDNLHNVLVLADGLSHAGYEVVEAHLGEEALQSVEHELPDCILLDIAMPGMDGYQVCRRLKANPRTNPIPVIVVSAMNESDQVIKGLDAGAEDYVTKPYEMRVVKARVRAVLRTKEAQDESRRTNALLESANQQLDETNLQLRRFYQRAHEFVDHVAHELRTPLTVIKGFAEIIGDGEAGPVNVQQRNYTQLISSQVDKLAFMVNDMLDVSRLEAGVLCVRRRCFKLHDVVGQAMKALRHVAQAGQTKLTANVDAYLPVVYADPEKISRVIVNLTTNAVKFAGEGGSVAIKARPGDNASEIVVEVSDDGPGIPTDKLEAIFERFQQVQADVRANAKGFGLGLSIAKELVGLNFGRMDVRSNVGNGSTFSFTVPSADPQHLIHRYLHWLDTLDDDRRFLSVVAISVEDDCPDDVWEQAEQWLWGTLHSVDLLLTNKPKQWLLVTATCDPDSANTIRHLMASWNEMNRGTLNPLPKLCCTSQGWWSFPSERSEFLERFSAVFEDREEIRV